MKELNKNKIILLVITALAIGVIYFLPNILTPYFYNQANGSNYGWRDMDAYDFEEMFSYGVSVKDILRGNIGGGDPYLWEYKNMPAGWDYYPLSLLVGLFFMLFHLKDIALFFIIGDFIFPPLSFIIIFFLFFRITKNFFFSVLSSLIFLFFPNIFVFKKLFSADFYNNFALIKITDLFAGSFNGDFSRLFVPALTIIFLSIFLLLLYHSISKNKIERRWLVLCGLAYGLLFYVYFYYWVFATISLGLLSVLFLFYNREFFWRATRIFIYGLVVSIPYWIRFFVLADNPVYGELKQRVGLLGGRVFISPSGRYWAVLFIFLFFGAIFWKRVKRNNVFFYILSLLLAVLAVRNLQLIFGFNPQPDHWGSRVTAYITVLAVLILIFLPAERILVKYKKSSSLILLTAIIFLLFIASLGQFGVSQDLARSQDMFFLKKDITDSFRWINENTDRNSVFLTDSETMRTALPFYTHANVYLPHACLSLASNGEIQERYAEVYAIYEVPIDLLKNSFEHNYKNHTYAQQKDINNNFAMFCIMYYVLSGDRVVETATPGNVAEAFIAKYEMTKPDMGSLKYRADYLFYGPYERIISNFDADSHSELKLVYSNDSVKIYKITK